MEPDAPFEPLIDKDTILRSGYHTLTCQSSAIMFFWVVLLIVALNVAWFVLVNNHKLPYLPFHSVLPFGIDQFV